MTSAPGLGVPRNARCPAWRPAASPRAHQAAGAVTVSLFLWAQRGFGHRGTTYPEIWAIQMCNICTCALEKRVGVHGSLLELCHTCPGVRVLLTCLNPAPSGNAPTGSSSAVHSQGCRLFTFSLLHQYSAAWPVSHRSTEVLCHWTRVTAFQKAAMSFLRPLSSFPSSQSCPCFCPAARSPPPPLCRELSLLLTWQSLACCPQLLGRPFHMPLAGPSFPNPNKQIRGRAQDLSPVHPVIHFLFREVTARVTSRFESLAPTPSEL